MIIGSGSVVRKVDMLDVFPQFSAKNLMIIEAEICVPEIKMQF